MQNITIIVPCYNESEVVNKFYNKVDAVLSPLQGYKFHYLFVNDGSQDDTLEIIRKLAEENDDVKYISFSRNFGKEAAMLAGLDYADGDAVVIMDADLQHPPELVPEMIEWWHKGYDDVCAKRNNRKDESAIKRNFTNLFYFCLKKCSRFEVQRDVGDFRLLDKRCVAALRMMREGQRYTKGLFTWIGYKKKELPYQVQPRAGGKTTWSYFALLKLALEGLTSYTTAPLRFTTLMGTLVSILAIIYMFFVLSKAIIYGDPVAGYPTLITVILFLGGVQLLSLGIIGEYLGRIFSESKHRPIYLVDEYNGEKINYADVYRYKHRQAEAILKKREDKEIE